jgi:hypothetical protein
LGGWRFLLAEHFYGGKTAVKPHQPSHKITAGGLSWLAVSSVVGGMAIGALTHFISLLIYLIILFPLGMGFAGGMVTAIAVRQGKVRHPAIAGLFGVLTGIVLYGSMHGADYWRFQQSATEQITQELGQANDTPPNQLIDEFLQKETGTTGFLGYLKYAAKEGVSIGRVGSRGFNLGETGTWIYWTLEFGAICVMTGAIAYFAARDPFCEPCNQWYGDKKHLGMVAPSGSEQFLSLLQRHELSPAGKLIDPLLAVQAPNWQVQQQQCALCEASDLYLTVARLSLNQNGHLERKEMLQGMLSPGESKQLQAGMTANLPHTADTTMTPEEVSLAQQERVGVTKADTFEPHGLNPMQIGELTGQLAHYQNVKAAYLVRKTVQHAPEKPFYVLGIMRRKALIEAEEAETKLLSQLTSELTLPGQTCIIPLNKDKGMAEKLQQTTNSEIYMT